MGHYEECKGCVECRVSNADVNEVPLEFSGTLLGYDDYVSKWYLFN